mgnify:CR=1 FL=1
MIQYLLLENPMISLTKLTSILSFGQKLITPMYNDDNDGYDGSYDEIDCPEEISMDGIDDEDLKNTLKNNSDKVRDTK